MVVEGVCWVSFVSAQRRSQMSCAEGQLKALVYVRPQSSLLLVITREQISHAIPLKVFQAMKSNR